MLRLSAMSSVHQQKSDCVCKTALTVLGCTVSLVGLFCVLGQLLTPWTLLGSVTYATIGPTLLLYNSPQFRQSAVSCLPVHLREMLFERSLMENLTYEPIYVKLVAFLVACVVLSRREVDELAASLPDPFHEMKYSSAIHLLATSQRSTNDSANVVPSKQPTSTSRPPMWTRWLGSVVCAQVPGCAEDKFLAKLVEIGARNAISSTTSAANSFVTRGTSAVVQNMRSVVSSEWVKWCTSLGLIATSALCCSWSALHQLPRQQYLHYMYDTARREGRSWLRLLETSLAGASVDQAVVLGMGLLGGAAAAISAHSVVFRMQLDVDVISGSKEIVRKPSVRIVRAGGNERVNFSSVTTPSSVQLLSLLLTRSQFKPIRPLLCAIFDVEEPNQLRVAGTAALRSGANNKEMEPRLVHLCFMLVALFAHRLRCHPSQYSWLSFVYYSKFAPLLKSDD